MYLSLSPVKSTSSIFAKAMYANELNAYKPIINELGIIDIKKARHPLIDKDKVVAIDIKLGRDYDAKILSKTAI